MAQKSIPNKGFSGATLEFLLALAMNNSKPWFKDHRDEYEKYLLEPMRHLVIELAPAMLRIDPAFETAPETDKTISRIYRDVRFSKDKSPYRANMWISFKRRTPDWKDSPVYYFEIFPDKYRFGMGYYSPSTQTMTAFRKAILARRSEFTKVISPIDGVFTLHGDDYKKRPDAPEDPALRAWYMKKNFYLAQNRETDKLLFSPKLAKHVEDGFILLAPLYRFLWSLAAG
jgi:uncharacterized protein (TIGR02453 family)